MCSRGFFYTKKGGIKMVKVTAIVNQKCGVSKTTTALNIGYELSQAGKKVLLIDFDPQASLSGAFGIDTEKVKNQRYNGNFTSRKRNRRLCNCKYKR